MIISDPSTASQKQPLLPQSNPSYVAAGSSSSAPPPSYAPHPVLVAPHRESAERRFIKAFIVAVLIWVLVGSFVRSSFDVVTRHISVGIPSVPKPEDGHPIHCFADLPTSTATIASKTSLSFNISLTSPHISLFSRGKSATGTVIFETIEEAGDDIRVDIDIESWDKRALWLLNVCLLDGPDGGKSIGIYAPTYRWPSSSGPSLDFTIRYKFPIRYFGVPVHHKITSLETDLSNFKHEFGDLDGKLTFNDLVIRGSNAEIRAKSLDVVSGRLETSNAAITGKFSTNSNLTLRTSNGRIEADFYLTNENEQTPVLLNARTSNGQILSSLNLISKGLLGSNVGGAFDVTTRTSNAHVQLSFPNAPIDSALNLHSRTSNSKSEIYLHPTYEGAFELTTSNSDSIVRDDDDLQDPKGEARKHYVDIKTFSKKSSRGFIRWGPAPGGENRGEVVSSTSNSRNILGFVH